MKPVMKAFGTQILILECGELLSSFAFHFNVRRYTKAAGGGMGILPYLLPLLVIIMVWRCSFNR